jgi:hypothetical protein
MTRDQFLANASEHLHDYRLDPGQLLSEWMREAWERPDVRSELTSEMARTVSKTGELCYTEAYLDLLARALDCDRVADLYREIREHSGRHEEEWRADFERRFAECADRLPFPLVFPQINQYLNQHELRVGWARDVWKDDHARMFLIEHMVADLAQGGDSWNRPDWMEQLDHGLSREQILELYEELRDRSGRPEVEWRPAFEMAFPDCACFLPSPRTR